MKPDNFEIIVRESDYTLTPANISRMQKDIARLLVDNYFSGRSKGECQVRPSACPAPTNINEGE